MLKEIESLSDIKVLVDSFYFKVRKDETLGPIFEKVIGEDWDPHLEKMYRFWQTVLLAEVAYSGSPIKQHLNLPLEKEHFEIWLQLFGETLDELFSGKIATEAKWRAEKMAEMFQIKIEYNRMNPGKLLV